MITSKTVLKSFLDASQYAPHDHLGMHQEKGKLVVRAFLRDAASCEVIDYEADPENRYPLQQVAEEGFFEGIIPDRSEPFAYRLRTVQHNGEIRQFHDAYNFLPTLSEQDLYLFNAGNEHRIYTKLGAHVRTLGDVQGVSFAVWAPSAQRVSVVGDFNHWDGRYHCMRALGSSGVWELFIPHLEEGLKYKFELQGKDGLLHLKTDPYGTFFESPPHNASIIKTVDDYEWNDQAWIEQRGQTNWKQAPMSIYEVHLSSWKRVYEDGKRPLSYRECADELVAYVKDMGFTHIEFMPLAEHPFEGSWGYQVTGFFAPTHRFGEPEDFQYLVDQCHQNGIGVIMDWVPGHFPADIFALARFDGTPLYEHEDPRQGFHMDWGTYIFNYGRHEVRCFLVANALAWMDRYHIDGLRVDAVASMLYLDYSRKEGEWIPNKYGGNENLEAIDFLHEVNRLIHEYYPGALMIAEESTAFGGVSKPVDEGGLGFDFKWNMGWMHDMLEYFKKDPLYRRWHHNSLTFGMIYQYSEHFVNVFSHDEVVHGKGSLIMRMAAPDMDAKAGSLRALLTLMWAWPGKNTLFMGGEFGQSSEWHYDSSLEWHLLDFPNHKGVQTLVRDLNHLYASQPAFHSTDVEPGGFEWIGINDAESSVISFLRKSNDGEDTFLVVGHYTPVTRSGYRVGVPLGGYWKEVLNSDASFYSGSGEGNMGGLNTEPQQWDGRPHSLCLTLPPNTTLIFKYEG